MTSALCARAIALIIGLLLLGGFQGCAHTPSSRPEAIQQQLGKIGVVVRSTRDKKTIEIPATGRLSNLGRGAGMGASLGAYGGTICGIGMVVCIPALAAAGAIGGSIVGTVGSESASMWSDAESAFAAALADVNFDEKILARTIAYSRENGYDTYRFPSGAQGEEQTQPPNPGSLADANSAILEISDPIIALVPSDFTINPPTRLVLSAQIRLKRSIGETVIEDRIVTGELGAARPLAEWTADSAKLFREEAGLGTNRLALAIIEQAFMLQKFSERRFSIDLMFQGYFTGLEPVYPPMTRASSYPNTDLAPKVSTLQPTLQWEAFKGSNVTYDLMIWRQDDLVYSREHLTEPLHTLDIPLTSNEHYFWTVRAWFTVDGRAKVTEWSRRSISPSAFFIISSLGVASLIGNHSDSTSGFYQFTTAP
jgi:hypothetical protein